MATISKVTTPLSGNNYLTVWSNLGVSDNGEGAVLPGTADRTVQVIGTFGAAGQVAMEGSLVLSPGANDWFAVTDSQGNSVVLDTTVKAEFLVENALWYRPVVQGGDGTTDLTVYLLTRGK